MNKSVDPSLLSVDFIAGAVAHRRQFGGGKSQLIAKAIGIKPGIYPSVLDLTGGLGKDAFVLASLGCEVTVFERNPVVFSALRDGLSNALIHAQQEDNNLLTILNRLTIKNTDSLHFLQQHTSIPQQVLYLDPMFPERKKSAAVKKDMVLMQNIVGPDEDSDELMLCALKADVYRVVVKRPKLAPSLANQEPSLVFRGSSSRFDVYPKRSLLSKVAQ